MARSLASVATAGALLAAACMPVATVARHVLLDRVLSDNPPPGQNDASCAHLVRAGLDEGVDAKGTPFVEPEVNHLISAMRLTWWECASEIANTLAKYGSEVEDAFQMEQRSVTKNLNLIKSALEKGKPVQSISPAFEWAQSGDWVYINAKMSHKLDAPATLNVVSEGVHMTPTSLSFAASKDQKRFALDLDLHAEIDPEPSTISFGSVGRVTFTLKKAEGGVKWPKLLAGTQKKPVNMHVWWAKQEEYAEDLDDLEEAAADAAIKAANVEGEAMADGAGAGSPAEEDKEGERAAAEEVTTPPTAEARLEKTMKGAMSILSKEKKSRVEELEKEKRAVMKSIDADATKKKNEAEDVFQAKRAVVDEDFDALSASKRAELEAAHASAKTEL